MQYLLGTSPSECSRLHVVPCLPNKDTTKSNLANCKINFDSRPRHYLDTYELDSTCLGWGWRPLETCTHYIDVTIAFLDSVQLVFSLRLPR
jgi:hypothetical protein